MTTIATVDSVNNQPRLTNETNKYSTIYLYKLSDNELCRIKPIQEKVERMHNVTLTFQSRGEQVTSSGHSIIFKGGYRDCVNARTYVTSSLMSPGHEKRLIYLPPSTTDDYIEEIEAKTSAFLVKHGTYDGSYYVCGAKVVVSMAMTLLEENAQADVDVNDIPKTPLKTKTNKASRRLSCALQETLTKTNKRGNYRRASDAVKRAIVGCLLDEADKEIDKFDGQPEKNEPEYILIEDDSDGELVTIDECNEDDDEDDDDVMIIETPKKLPSENQFFGRDFRLSQFSNNRTLSDASVIIIDEPDITEKATDAPGTAVKAIGPPAIAENVVSVPGITEYTQDITEKAISAPEKPDEQEDVVSGITKAMSELASPQSKSVKPKTGGNESVKKTSEDAEIYKVKSKMKKKKRKDKSPSFKVKYKKKKDKKKRKLSLTDDEETKEEEVYTSPESRNINRNGKLYVPQETIKKRVIVKSNIDKVKTSETKSDKTTTNVNFLTGETITNSKNIDEGQDDKSASKSQKGQNVLQSNDSNVQDDDIIKRPKKSPRLYDNKSDDATFSIRTIQIKKKTSGGSRKATRFSDKTPKATEPKTNTTKLITPVQPLADTTYGNIGGGESTRNNVTGSAKSNKENIIQSADTGHDLVDGLPVRTDITIPLQPPPLPPIMDYRTPRRNDLRYIVIDGSNVAMAHGQNRVFSCRGIRICVEYFRRRGHQLITAFLPHWRKCRPQDGSSITHRYELDNLEKDGFLVYTPSRRIGNKLVAAYDDRFIIELADREDGIVVSNDQYRDLKDEKYSWRYIIQNRLLMYSFVHDHFMVPNDPLGRYGPTLDVFLRQTNLKHTLKSLEVRNVSPIEDTRLQDFMMTSYR